MLKIFRQQASSWPVKVAFSVIILVFIFFFGYTRMQKGGGETGIAARINGENIPYGRYKLAFENTSEFYKNMFPDQMSDEIKSQIMASALHQIINETLLKQLAEEFGIKVTIKEIYDVLANNPNLQKDGVFDPISYKNVFLPYFERRYGIHYEWLLKNSLLADKTRNFLGDSVRITEEEARKEFDRKETTWSFERITIPTNISENDKFDVEGEVIAKQLVDTIRDGSLKTANELIDKYKLTKEEIKDINVDSKHRLIPADQTGSFFLDIFSLTKDNFILAEPILSGTSLYVFKLIDSKKPNDEKWGKEKDDFQKVLLERKKQEYLMQWQENLKNKSKIEQFVLNAGN